MKRSTVFQFAWIYEHVKSASFIRVEDHLVNLGYRLTLQSCNKSRCQCITSGFSETIRTVGFPLNCWYDVFYIPHDVSGSTLETLSITTEQNVLSWDHTVTSAYLQLTPKQEDSEI